MKVLFLFLSLLGTSALAQTPADTVLANQYYHTGDSLYEQGQYSSSNEYFQQAQRIYEKAEYWERYIACHNNIARNLLDLAEYDSVSAIAEKVLVLSKQHLNQHHPEIATAYSILGFVQKYAGQFETAIDYFQQALIIRKASLPENHPSIADSYTNLGIAFEDIGEYNQSLTYHQKSLAIKKALYKETNASIAATYSNIGWVYSLLGDQQQALNNLNQALRIYIELFGSSHSKTVAVYSNIAQVYNELGAYQQALVYHQKSLLMTKELFGEDHPQLAYSYIGTGNVYDNMGEYDLAITYYQKFLTLYTALFGEEHPYVAGGYTNLSTVYRKQQDYSQALHYFQKALAIYKTSLGEEHPYVADAYVVIGELHQDQQEYAQAATYYQQALTLSQAIYGENSRRVAQILSLMATHQYQQGHSQEALAFYQQSIAANVPAFHSQNLYANPSLVSYIDALELLRAFQGKANVLESVNDSAAYATYRLADSLIQRINRSYQTREDKMNFNRLFRQVYEGAIRTSEQRYQATDEPGYQQAAVYFAEQSKAGVLNEALSGLEARHFGQVPDTLLALEASLRTERAGYQSRLQPEAKLTEEEITQIQGQQFEVNRRYDSLIRVLEEQYPNYYQLKYASRTATVDEVQSHLSPSSALLSYFMGDSARYVMVITPDRYAIVPLPGDTLLNQHIQGLRQLLTPEALSASGSQTFAEHAHALHENLLPPVMADSLLAGIKDLIIVPDGELGYLPFELLLTQPTTGKADYRTLPYLLRDYNVSYAYSATWLFHPFSPRERLPQKEYIAFAPSYPSASEDSLTLGRFRDQVAPLRWNQQEVRSINRYLSGLSLTGEEATEGRFKQQANQYDIIHLAMHALVDDLNPMYSQLVFATDDADTVNDGYLNAYELYNMELSADLAVLSACETGYGKLEGGEGIMSLARAFAYAGCPSIVMSHWPVDDQASTQLMDYFYQYLSEGASKDEALRQAKLSFLENANEQTMHPFYWSNFVVVGNTDAVAESSLWGWWVLGSVVLVVVVVMSFWRLKGT